MARHRMAPILKLTSIGCLFQSTTSATNMITEHWSIRRWMASLLWIDGQREMRRYTLYSVHRFVEALRRTSIAKLMKSKWQQIHWLYVLVLGISQSNNILYDTSTSVSCWISFASHSFVPFTSELFFFVSKNWKFSREFQSLYHTSFASTLQCSIHAHAIVNHSLFSRMKHVARRTLRTLQLNRALPHFEHIHTHELEHMYTRERKKTPAPTIAATITSAIHFTQKYCAWVGPHRGPCW